MKIPTLSETESFLAEAADLNPGPWVAHSRYVAEAARQIALHHPELEPEAAYILGCLHDIGRREGITGMRHIIDGYHFLAAQGYEDAARICLTHSFPAQDIREAFGKWDCTQEEYNFVADYLLGIQCTVYDKLFQLCDALALPDGCCLLEKRFIDVVLRYGFNDFTLDKWRATFAIKEQFEQEIGCSIYELLPNVVETTFNG
ncbi:MAG: HD domain-containing protein [Chloroflexi bacterium]|nr:HD domain-containing protein [Chloroflexota bacterium]